MIFDEFVDVVDKTQATETKQEEVIKTDNTNPINEKIDDIPIDNNSLFDESSATKEPEKSVEEVKTDDKVIPEPVKEEGEEVLKEINPFDIGEKVSEESNEGETKQNQISLKALSEKFGVKLKDETEDEFIQRLNEKIESSKQEFKLDGYNDVTKKLIQHMNTEGSNVADFFNNKRIVDYNDVLNMGIEEKYRAIKLAEYGDNDNALEKIDEELSNMSTRELKDFSDDVDSRLREGINKEIETVVESHEKEQKAKQDVLMANKEKFIDTIVSQVKSTNDFLGFKLNDDIKNSLVNNIRNGEFEKVTQDDEASVKFLGYMMKKYGKNLLEGIETRVKREKLSSYNEGLKKSMQTMYNTSENNTTHRGNSNLTGDAWGDEQFK